MQHAAAQCRLPDSGLLNVDRRAQWMVLSAASAQESDAGSNAGPQSIVQLASCTLRMTSAARAVVAEP